MADQLNDPTWMCPQCKTEVFNAPTCGKCGHRRGEPHREVQAPQAQRVVVTDFDMPFGSMVGFMVKWSIAAIPALLILGALVIMIVLLLGGLGGALNNNYR